MSDSRSDQGPLVAHARIGALSAYLDAHGVAHEIVEHDPAFTAASEARAAAVPPDQAAKTVVLQDHGAYLLALVPASERLDLHKVRDLLGASRSLRLANEEEIAAHFTQYELGSVSPIGGALFAGTIVDRRLAALQDVLCASGDHRHSVIVSAAEILHLTGARIADVCED